MPFLAFCIPLLRVCSATLGRYRLTSTLVDLLSHDFRVLVTFTCYILHNYFFRLAYMRIAHAKTNITNF